MRFRVLVGTALLLLVSGLPRAGAGVLVANGFDPATYQGIWDRAGVGANKSNVSVAEFPYSIMGFAATGTSRLADDFTVAAGETWTISEIRLYGYQTFATSFSIVSASVSLTGPDTNGAALESAAGVPVTEGPGGIVARRVTSTTLTDDDRRVFEISVPLATPWTVGPGDYWLRWSLGHTTNQPSLGLAFGVPIVPTDGGGNAQIFRSASGAFVPATESNTGLTAEFPFMLIGTVNATAAVPEPATIASLALGIALPLSLALARRRTVPPTS